VHDVCSQFASCLFHRVNGVLLATLLLARKRRIVNQGKNQFVIRVYRVVSSFDVNPFKTTWAVVDRNGPIEN